ncbi:MAG TPA: aldo/keto reductase [Acidimicrobiales bacterium]|nr:aldo/keto reductase [Acidimicrobiales bacterium]
MPTEQSITYADQTVHRLGYGAMRITGPGVWGWPADVDQALAVLRRAVELGVDFIDTADSYGPEVSEFLIHQALHPFHEVRVATKAGFLRTGPNQWTACGRPDYLRQQCELSLRRLGVERLDLFQLHRIDSTVPAEEQFGLLRTLLDEGKIAAVGLSAVNVEQVAAARAIVPVATVQNLYNVTDRQSEDVLNYCEANHIGFIPYFPVAAGKLANPGGALDALAARLDLSVSQLSLAWLLHHSPVMMPIPGTSKVAHLEENCLAASVELDEETMRLIETLVA